MPAWFSMVGCQLERGRTCLMPSELSSDPSRAFSRVGPPLAPPASSVFSCTMGKWVKQPPALRGTKPANGVSSAASYVSDEMLAGAHTGMLPELLGPAASFV